MGEFCDQGINFGFRTDVHTPGGFIQNENFWVDGEPLGDGALLLIAATEAGHWELHISDFDG